MGSEEECIPITYRGLRESVVFEKCRKAGSGRLSLPLSHVVDDLID